MSFPMFGIGILTMTSTTANSTPRRLSLVKDVSVSFKSATEKLYGDGAYPEDIANARKEITGKGKFAALDGNVIATLLNGTATTANVIPVIDEAGTPTANTLTVTHGADMVENIGIIRVSTGLPMSRVTGTPSAGQYSLDVASGTYTFAAADSNPPVLASYTYDVAGSGVTVTPTANEKMGAGSTFGLNLGNVYRSKTWLLRLPALVISGVDLSVPSEKHAEIDFTFEAFKDSTGVPFYTHYTE